MKKSLLAFSAIVPLIAVATASAADVNLYFSRQPTPAAVPPVNASCTTVGPASNPTLYLAPKSQCDNLAGVFASRPNYDHLSMDIRMTVATKGSGCGGETISSLGLDIQQIRTTGANTVTASTGGFTVHTLAATTGSAQNPWSSPSPNAPTLNAGSNFVSDSRAVAVPAGHAPAEILWNGYCPTGANNYKVATLSLQSDANTSTGETDYALRMAVGNLKITRVYDPSAMQGTATETVAFGTGDASVSGSTVGAVSANADAIVVVRKKGDYGQVSMNVFSPVPDGRVNADDKFAFLQSIGADCSTDPLHNYLGDFGYRANNVDHYVPDGNVNASDYFLFLQAIGS